MKNMFRKIPFLVWPLSLETVERKGTNWQIIQYPNNKKGFLEEIKTIFHNFWNAFFW